MMPRLHHDISADMFKIEQRQRLAGLEHRQALAERQATSRFAGRPQVHAVRRVTVALAGAGLAFAAFLAHLI